MTLKKDTLLKASELSAEGHWCTDNWFEDEETGLVITGDAFLKSADESLTEWAAKNQRCAEGDLILAIALLTENKDERQGVWDAVNAEVTLFLARNCEYKPYWHETWAHNDECVPKLMEKAQVLPDDQVHWAGTYWSEVFRQIASKLS